MALISLGVGIGAISGSVGGTTFARNRSGAYMRQRSMPINPNTTRQQAVRAIVASLSTRWAQTLTSAQRAAWDLYGSSVVMKNRLGQDVYNTGFNHYIRSNTVISQASGTLVDDGPTIFELPAQDPSLSCTASEATQLVSVAFDDTLAWANEDDGWLTVKLGQPQNAQRNFFGGPWRFTGAIAGITIGPPTTPDDQTASFPIAEGQRLWIECRAVLADGRVSEPFRADCFCAA